MLRRLLTCWVAVATIASCGVTAHAQVGRGGMSAFGSGGFGSSGFGPSGFGSSGFGSSGFGTGGFGSSGFGNSFGSGGFGSGGFGSSSFGSSGFGSSTSGNQLYGPGNFGGGRAFVGRDAGDMQSVWNQLGASSTQFFNQMNRNMSRSDRASRPAAPTIQNPPQKVRVELQVAFNAPQPASDVVASKIRTRLERLSIDHSIGQPVVTMEGDTAVLGGVAATENQRLVVERLISMEPGVRQVRNEMVVAEPPGAEVAP